MKNLMKSSALVLTGALLIAACGNKEQKSETNVNENPTQEKIEVKAVEGRKNFSDKAVITPLPAIMIMGWPVWTKAYHLRTLQAQDNREYPPEEGFHHQLCHEGRHCPERLLRHRVRQRRAR